MRKVIVATNTVSRCGNCQNEAQELIMLDTFEGVETSLCPDCVLEAYEKLIVE